MAKKYEISTNETGLIFVDVKSGKKVEADAKGAFDFAKKVELSAAILASTQEIGQRGYLTECAMSMLFPILTSAKLGAYAGKVPMGHAIPVAMKSTVIRDLETEILKPEFSATWLRKNPAPDGTDMKKVMEHTGALEQAWADFIQAHRKGGIYGQCKSAATQYLAYYGRFPCAYNADGTPDTDRMYRPSAILKMIANDMVRDDADPTGLIDALNKALKVLDNATVPSDTINAALILAGNIVTKLTTIKDSYASDATAKAQQLPPTGIALQAGDKAQDADKTIADMAKQALDKAAIKPVKKASKGKAQAVA
jgi:hypothetical protein